MKKKSFALHPDQIKSVAEGYGRCFATDRITVDGQRVGYLYREQPHDIDDSGWNFFAGDEPEGYLEVPENVGIFDVNTIANYDPRIVPLLNNPPGTAFFLNTQSGQFELDADRPKRDD